MSDGVAVNIERRVLKKAPLSFRAEFYGAEAK